MTHIQSGMVMDSHHENPTEIYCDALIEDEDYTILQTILAIEENALEIADEDGPPDNSILHKCLKCSMTFPTRRCERDLRCFF